jgi:NAD-dependent SIR2 family protein deacetylase
MAWFRNHYRCVRCHRKWTDEWSCTCDDDCPHCGAPHMSPAASDDLTIIVDDGADGVFIVLQSPDSAEHDPAYQEVAHFPTKEAADAWRPA